MTQISMLRAAVALLLSTLAGSVTASIGLADSQFIVESHQAMDRMMTGMAAPSSGDADHDFATMMIPHHQGAIDMAIAELKFGRDPRLRRIAQEIIVDQRQEIVVMSAVIATSGGAGARPAAPPITMSDGRKMK